MGSVGTRWTFRLLAIVAGVCAVGYTGFQVRYFTRTQPMLSFDLQVFFVVPKKNRIKRAQGRSQANDVDSRIEREHDHPSISHRYGISIIALSSEY